MLQQLRELRGTLLHQDGAPEPAAPEPEPSFAGLRVLTAQLLLATAAGTALDARAASTEETPRAATWAPLLLGPLAAAAHLAHAFRPSSATTAATRVVDATVIGLGVAELTVSLLTGRRQSQPPSLAGVALGAAGVLGILLRREEQRVAAEREELERRAAVVERWVPQRRAKLDRVVVHV